MKSIKDKKLKKKWNKKKDREKCVSIKLPKMSAIWKCLNVNI